MRHQLRCTGLSETGISDLAPEEFKKVCLCRAIKALLHQHTQFVNDSLSDWEPVELVKYGRDVNNLTARYPSRGLAPYQSGCTVLNTLQPAQLRFRCTRQ